MGLDQYLTAEMFIRTFGEKDETELEKKVSALFPELKDAKISTVVADVGYWRKANAIHKWFVDNAQDGIDECQKSEVTVEQLRTLLDIVKVVLADTSKANELLPPEAGFFFGSTDIDEWYIEELTSTKKILEDAIALNPGDAYRGWAFYYQSSW